MDPSSAPRWRGPDLSLRGWTGAEGRGPIASNRSLRIASDCFAWLVVHLGSAWLGSRLPAWTLERDTWLLRPRAWELGGRLYQHAFAVRRWKHLLPDGAPLLPGGFAKRHLRDRSRTGLETYLRETRRAELSHWLAVLPAPAFLLWNPWWVGLFMLVYAVAVNGPCIVVQRYNRARVSRVLALQSAHARRNSSLPKEPGRPDDDRSTS